MGRIRSIKPEFAQSESMGRLSREARLFFIQLWTICDDSGRARAHSRVLASVLYPFDDDALGLIDGWIEELEMEGCITRYVAEGTKYIQVTNWLKHQKIDKPSKPRYPEKTDKKPSPRGTVAKPRETVATGRGSKDEDEEEEKDKEEEQRRHSAKVEPLIDFSVAARVLSERVGNLDIRFQEQMERTIRSQQQPDESLEAIVDRMAGQWQKYNVARPELNYPMTSVRRFFESGIWHDEALWPRKEVSNGAHSNNTARGFESVTDHNKRVADETIARIRRGGGTPNANG